MIALRTLGFIGMLLALASGAWPLVVIFFILFAIGDLFNS